MNDRLETLARAVVEAWRDDSKDATQAIYDLAEFLDASREITEDDVIADEQSLDYFNHYIAGDR